MGEIRPHQPQKTVSKYALADPGYYCLALSFQATLAGLMGAACWLFFRPPDAFMILLTPALMVIMTHQLRIRKDGLWWLFLTTLNMAVGTFVFSALFQERYLILIFLFIYTFLNFVSHAYRPIGSMVVLLATMGTSLPGGWHNGVNHAVMILLSFGIVGITCVAFSQVYGSSIRSVLHLLSKQVFEAYGNTMVRPVRKTEFSKNEQGIVAHYSAIALKADFLIRKAVFYLPRTRHFQQKAVPVLIALRRLMADRELIREMHETREEMRSILPKTGEIIDSIQDRLNGATQSLARRNIANTVGEKGLQEGWQRRADTFLNAISATSKTARVIYGIRCILRDLRRIEIAISNLNDPQSKLRRQGFKKNPMTGSSDLPPQFQTGLYQDAFKAAAAITLAMFFWKATHLPHGYWLLMTTCLVLFGGNQGHVLQRAGHRLIGTTLGIVMAYLFVVDFLSYNIYWAGVLPLVFFLMFYLYFLTGNYGIMVFFVSIYVGVLLSTLSGSGETIDFFLFGTLFNRFVCTLLAGLLVVFCEAAIFPNGAVGVSADSLMMPFLQGDCGLYLKRFPQQTF